MPDLDGFETAEYIKRRRKTRAIPIIFVTAISKERHHVFRGYETGAVDYVFKPYDPQLLRAKVQVFLELYEATRAVQRSEELLRATFDSRRSAWRAWTSTRRSSRSTRRSPASWGCARARCSGGRSTRSATPTTSASTRPSAATCCSAGWRPTRSRSA
jgi:DNA-binding response OmpR family regulator